MDCIAMANKAFTEQKQKVLKSNVNTAGWNDFMRKLKKEKSMYKSRTEAMEFEWARRQADE